ncbi:DUF7563 family protein [Halobaculum sp. P14]|uniref:DUF7563 family protein n=1 Tax=Halobaculum sp. P14 TaxID=3421638 RepID=UPI003EBD78CF
MPDCENCGSAVSADYVRVFAPDDMETVRVCPFCEDKIRDGTGDVRDARSTRTPRSDDRDTDDQLVTDGGEAYPDAPITTDRTPVEELSGKDLVAEKRELSELLAEGCRPHTDEWHDYVYNRSWDVWNEIRARAETEPPTCDNCGESKWSQAPGDPVRCNGCGVPADRETEQAVHDAWNRMESEARNVDPDDVGGEAA